MRLPCNIMCIVCRYAFFYFILQSFSIGFNRGLMERKQKDYAVLMLKGIGAADVVSGVSGCTIAFIVGIYDELIDSIKSIDTHSLKLLFTGKLEAFWQAINGNFLFLEKISTTKSNG